MFYWFSFYLIKCLGTIFSPRTVLGREKIPASGSFIIASNHLSNLDPFLIGLCIHRRLSYMAKDLLFRHPFLRFCLRRVGAFPVRRGSADVWALRETLRRLRNGYPVVMFPEGTRGGGAGNKIQSGLGFLAVKGNIPVLPVCIEGSDKVLPRGAKIPKRGRVTLTFGNPMTFAKTESYEDIARQVMHEIKALRN